MRTKEEIQKYTTAYNAKAYEQIKINSRKENRIGDLLDIACSKTGLSKAQYILNAIKTQLEKDGINADMLPQLDQETD